MDEWVDGRTYLNEALAKGEGAAGASGCLLVLSSAMAGGLCWRWGGGVEVDGYPLIRWLGWTARGVYAPAPRSSQRTHGTQKGAAAGPPGARRPAQGCRGEQEHERGTRKDGHSFHGNNLLPLHFFFRAASLATQSNHHKHYATARHQSVVQLLAFMHTLHFALRCFVLA